MRLALVLASVLLLAGCTAAPVPEPTSTALTMPAPVVVSGIGEQRTELAIPPGAQSLRVRLACTFGQFHVATNSDASAHGTCGAGEILTLPLSEAANMRLAVYVDPAATVVAEFAFSTEPVDIDAALAADCEAVGEAESHLYNASAGFRAGDLDAAGWRDRMDEGAAVLEGMTPSPILAAQVETYLEWATTASDPMTAEGERPNDAAALISALCAANHTTIAVIAEYGG